MREVTVRVHAVEEDGFPKREVIDEQRMAFVFDGAMISGWPSRLDPRPARTGVLWEAHPDVSPRASEREFSGVTHWLEFPVPVGTLVQPEPDPRSDESAALFERYEHPDEVPVADVDVAVSAVLAAFDRVPWDRMSLRAVVGAVLVDQVRRRAGADELWVAPDSPAEAVDNVQPLRRPAAGG